MQRPPPAPVALSWTRTWALLPFMTAKQHLKGMGRDLENNNPPQESRTCLQSVVSYCQSSLKCLKTALGASCSPQISLTQSQSQVCQGILPWSPPGWLQPSQLMAGITPALQGDNAPLKKHPMRDSRVPTLTPLPCSATTAHPPGLSQCRAQSLQWGQAWGYELRAVLELPSPFNHC